MRTRIIAFGLIVSVCGGMVPVAAFAGENEAKNAAIGATAVSAYLLTHRKSRGAGIAGAAGSAYLWKKYHDSRKARHRRELARERRARRQTAYWRSRYRAQRRYALSLRRNANPPRRVTRTR
jgi:hypothetical protein